MRLTTLWLLSASLLFSANAMAIDKEKAPSAAQSAQRQKMADCNQQAANKSLKGEPRKEFMSHCLRGDSHPVTQQEKMKACNTEAKTKDLKGEDRKKFMSNCLKKAA